MGGKLLASDIGGVCLTLHPERTLRAFGLDGNMLTGDMLDWYHEYSCGRIGSLEYGQRIADFLGGTWDVEKVHSAWNLWLGEEIKETTAMFERLWQDGWTIVFLSDVQPWHIEHTRNVVLSYSSRIPDGIYSFEVGAEKPSQAMYQAFEDRFGKPDLYIDDLPGNIEAAARFGWNARQVCYKRQA